MTRGFRNHQTHLAFSIQPPNSSTPSASPFSQSFPGICRESAHSCSYFQRMNLQGRIWCHGHQFFFMQCSHWFHFSTGIPVWCEQLGKGPEEGKLGILILWNCTLAPAICSSSSFLTFPSEFSVPMHEMRVFPSHPSEPWILNCAFENNAFMPLFNLLVSPSSRPFKGYFPMSQRLGRDPRGKKSRIYKPLFRTWKELQVGWGETLDLKCYSWTCTKRRKLFQKEKSSNGNELAISPQS